jgi:hypothetical protein
MRQRERGGTGETVSAVEGEVEHEGLKAKEVRSEE